MGTRRYVGEAVVYIQYEGSDEYRGSIVCRDRSGALYRWAFKDLHAPRIGFPFAYDGPEAYDRMVSSACTFGSYYTSYNRPGEGTEEDLELVESGYPDRETADAIDEAVGYALQENGEYEMRRRASVDNDRETEEYQAWLRARLPLNGRHAPLPQE